MLNCRERNVRRSSRAESVRCKTSCRMTKPTRDSAPTTMGTHGATGAWPDTASPIELSPKMSPPNPSAERTTDSTSNFAGRVSMTLRSQTAPRTSERTANGRTSQNIHRQFSAERMRPATVGPMAGATAITTEMTPIIRPRCVTGTIVSTVVISSGIITAVPPA